MLTITFQGLSILYGADYFTEREWIKVDGLIHKGNYVFTNGPPLDILEEQLISFDDAESGASSSHHHIQSHADLAEEEVACVLEKQKSTLFSSNGDLHSETPNETSAASSYGETRLQTSLDPPMFDFSEDTTPASSTPAGQSFKDGLDVGYAQDQFYEMMLFDAVLTNTGQKKHSSYASVEDDPSTIWGKPTAQFYPLPAPTEREAMISNWATDVNAAKIPSPTIASATPQAQYPQVLVHKFVEVHSQNRKSTNDYHQTNHPHFTTGEIRSESRASMKPVKSAVSGGKTFGEFSPSAAGGATFMPKLNILPGTVLKAQRSAPATSRKRLDVLAGDNIRVLKHVSGSLHFGQNLRTNSYGQVCEDDFKAPLPTAANESTPVKQLGLDRWNAAERNGPGYSPAQRELDEIERRNASAWDEAPVGRRKKMPVLVIRPGGGSALSFSSLDNPDTQNNVKGKQERGPAQVEGFKEMVSNEVLRVALRAEIEAHSV